MKTFHKTGAQSAENPYKFIMSTSEKDLMGDHVVQDFDLGSFQQNPVALFGHDHKSIIGTWERVGVVGGKLTGYLKMAKAGTSDLVDEVRSLIEQKILRAVSVGFQCRQADPLEDGTGYRLSQNVLTECSVVAVGANQSALLATKSLSPELREIIKQSSEEETMYGNAAPVGELKKVPAVHTTEHKYSINNVLQRALEGEKPDGIEQEFHQEAVKRMGARGSQARGIQIPLSALFPQKSHGTVSSDPGNTLAPLTGTDYMDSLFTQTGDAILACPLAKRLGMMQITSNEETVHIPVQTGPLEAGWVPRDKPFHRSKDAIFTGIDMTPKILSLLTMFERSSIYATHPQARALLMAQIGQVVSAALDSAVVEGGVTDGPQMGLLSDAAAGSNAVLATLAAGIHKNMSGLERYTKCDMSPTVVMAPETLHEMSSIPAWSGATVPLLQSGILDSLYPTVSSVKMPYVSGTQVGTALMGDFSTGVLCLWDSVGVELNPYTTEAWSKGAIDARLFLEADFVLRDANLVRKFTVTTK